MLSSAHALNDTPLNEHVVKESVVEAEPLEIWYVNPPLGIYLFSDQNVAKHKGWVIYLFAHQDEVVLAWTAILPRFAEIPWCTILQFDSKKYLQLLEVVYHKTRGSRGYLFC